MAGSNTTVEHKLRLLIETQLDEKQKEQVGKQLKNILQGAAIGFDEAETKRNLTPIIRMIQKLFDKAEMKFDADKLLGMPSQQALQKVADITADEFQTAFDRALAKSGGVKIDFGNVDLSGMTEPLERVVGELADINRKIANDTKKSVDDIDLAIKRLNKIKPKTITTKITEDGVEKEVTREVSKAEQTAEAIEKTLNLVNNPKALNGEIGAARALKSAADNYKKSVEDGEPWEVQYQHMIKFVSKYEAMAEKIKPIIDTNHSEFKELYDILSPKAGAAKISLEHFVDVTRGNELSEYKNQPWARESTLKKIEQTLKNGISVKDGGDKNSGNAPKEQPKPQFAPGDEEEKKNKKPNTKVPLSVGESEEEKATRLAKEREDAALREAERKRIEQERVAEAERAAAEKRRVAEEKAIAEARRVYAKEIYRVVYEPDEEESRGEHKARYGGTEIWTDNRDVAETYAIGDDPVILHGSVDAQNAYIIDAGGAKWNQFDKMNVLTPNGLHSDGVVKFDKKPLSDTFPDLFNRINSGEFDQDEEIQSELYRLINNLGYDSIITKNVKDSINPDNFRELSNIYAIIDDRILKVLDAFAMEEQDEYGVTTFEEKPRRENIPDYYKMPEVADMQVEADAHHQNAESIAEEVEVKKELNKQIINPDDDAEILSKENGELKDKLELLRDIADQYGNDITQRSRNRYEELNQKDMDGGLTAKEEERFSELGDQIIDADNALAEFGETYEKITLKLANGKKVDILPDDKGLRSLYKFADGYGSEYDGIEIDDVVFERAQKEISIHQANTDAIVDEIRAIEQLNTSIEEKNGLESRNNGQSEATDIDNKTESINRQNDELKENIALKSQANEQNIDAASQASTNLDTNGHVEVKASIDTEELRNLLNAITYNVKVVQDVEPADDKKVSIDEVALESVLNRIVYDVKIVHDDADKTANKIALDEGALEATLTRVFSDILNSPTQQNDLEPTEERWALESTLQTIKGVLDNIQTNTANFGTIQISNVDAIAGSTLEGKLVEIKSVLESIDSKIAKGGVIATRGAVKQANSQPVEPEAKAQAARSNMLKSIINDYKTLGKLAAQFANDGNLETKAMLENLKEEIARKRQSLKLTMDENKSLREKYSIAFDAEKRLLDAEKAQDKIDEQNKQNERDEKAEWKKRVKDAQRETGINAADSTYRATNNTVIRAIGTEGISADIEAKAKELAEQNKALNDLRNEIDKKGIEASEQDRDNLSKQIAKVKELKTEVDGYLKIHEKYSGEGATQFDVDTSNFGAVGTNQYWNSITAAIKQAAEGRVAIKGMNADTGELTGTTKIAANTFAEWSATVNPVTGKLSMLRTGIKKTETIIEQITRKTKEIFTYFSGSSIIFKAFNELKKGVQYVKEIDLALTELKKVTDETEETYDKFLKTAAQTADKVGSTIQKVVSSTADWARLNI